MRAGIALSYTDNADGTVTDNNTGLMWEKKSDDGTINDKDATYTWDQAFSVHVAGLNSAAFAAHTDWRVPNLRELLSIVNYQILSPSMSPAFNTGCTPGCAVTGCSCTQPSVHWSSTSVVEFPADAWGVNLFFVGAVNGTNKNGTNSIRAVRGGS